MLPLREIAQLGSAVEKIGRAAAPGSQTALVPRTAHPAPVNTIRGDYSIGSDLDMLEARTWDEAIVDNHRARQYQAEAVTLGASLGGLFGLGLATWLKGRR